MNQLKFWFILLSVIALVNGFIQEDNDWSSFKKNHAKRYKNTNDESKRRSNWLRKRKLVNDHNARRKAGKETYEVELNSFSDYSNEELQRLTGYVQSTASELTNTVNNITESSIRSKRQTLPGNFSWSSYGAVSPVQNQGSCGCCWAFAATGSLEGRYFSKTGKLPYLSEQQLVDCDYINSGCAGGNYNYAIKYWNVYGFQNDTTYPYNGIKNFCKARSKYYYKNYRVSSVCNKFNTTNNETLMKSVLYSKWPVAVAIYVQSSFFYYKSGIYSSSTCKSDIKDLNHAVLLVGYGTENGSDYWLVKNSWGASWGEKGYFRIARNAKNMCGIVSSPCFIDLI